ncbi:MAG: TRC40/GET3/ArsA family transport-energizing ATPase [Methanomicrobia archaeon]|nr:TRC40/GET3/ArsA family transport-energizing ATPase [Methanomicrobia archaeon]
MRVLFYTGTGGAGKSVISAATALNLAERGYRTLLIAAGPAYPISALFETEVHHTPTQIVEQLSALHIDPLREIRANYERIHEYLLSLFRAEALDEQLVYAFASLPLTNELIALLKLVELVNANAYDAIVLDTLPSGESLRNVYLPTLLGSNAATLIKLTAPFANVAKVAEPIIGIPTPDRAVIDEDIKLLEMLRNVKRIILDREHTSLRLIATPDTISIQGMKRTYLLAQLYGINVDLAIMNRVMPDELTHSCPAVWSKEQERTLFEVEAALRPLPLKTLKLIPPPISGIPRLSAIGEALFGAEDPALVFHTGEPVKVRTTEAGLELVVPLPSASHCKAKCEVERVGEDLSVVMATELGEVRNFVALPAGARAMRLAKARLAEDGLRISFINP